MELEIEHDESTNSILQTTVKKQHNPSIPLPQSYHSTQPHSTPPPRSAPNLLKSYGLGMVFRRVLEGCVFWQIKPESHLPARAEMEYQIHMKHNVFLHYLCGVRARLKQIMNVTEPL